MAQGNKKFTTVTTISAVVRRAFPEQAILLTVNILLETCQIARLLQEGVYACARRFFGSCIDPDHETVTLPGVIGPH